MAIVTFDHYKYTPEQALGAELVRRTTDIYHNGDMTVAVAGVTQAEANEALAINLIASAKANKHDEINKWRDTQEAGGFDHAGHRWDSDSSARERIIGVAPLCLVGIDPPPGYWTDADNINVTMNAAEFVAMYTAMLVAGGEVHKRQRVMKTELDALTNLEDVESYVVGWP